MEDDMNDFEMIEFWGEEIPPGGKPSAVVVENEPPVFSMVHVTGCALGEAPKPGPHVLKAMHQGKAIVLATLEKGGATQFRLDFGISSSATFINTGASPLYISGYITRSVQHIEGSDDEDDEDDEDEDSEDDLEDSDDGEPPRLVPIRGAANGKAKRASPFVEDEADETDEEDSDAEMEDDSSDDSDEGEEGSSDEEEDEDEEEDFDRRLGAKSFGSDEEDEDEEGLPELNSDDLVAEADSDDEDEGEDDSDSDGPPPEQKSKAKRGAQPATPQPAKKQKKEDARVPASAPPKVQQQKQQQKAGGGGGDPESQYLAAIVDFLKSEGKPVPLAALGSHVKRPDSIKAKAKAFVVAHADKLAFDEKKQTVALKK